MLEKLMTKNTLYVGNLNYKINENQLVGILGKFGKIGKVNLIVDPVTKKNKGIAFVEIFGHDSAKKAIKALDGKEIDGRTLKISIAKENEKAKNKPLREKTSKLEKADLEPAKKRVKRKKGLDLLFANISK